MLASEQSFDCGYQRADTHVRHEAVVDPVAREADDEKNVLHGGRGIVAARARSGPIDQNLGSARKGVVQLRS
jgi:hypothetical protein